jgi:hypothetical protein
MTHIRAVLEGGLCLPLQTLVIRGAPKLHKSRTPVSILTIRCSIRLAAKPREADSTKQAQSVLMQKLGVMVPSPKFKAVFQAPLSASKHGALQLLFGGDFDPVTMNLDMVGIDGDEA